MSGLRAARAAWPVLLWLAVAPCGAEERVVDVCAAGVPRQDAVADFPYDSRAVDVSSGGRPVSFQADSGRMTLLLEGELGRDACRSFRITTGAGEPRVAAPLVTAEELDDYQGEPTFRIATPRATYFYHRGGSGFASLVDQDGNDWISYRPEGGFEGDYRGIPNIAPPDFHPGRPEGKKPSRLVASGPLRATIVSETEDGRWRVRWDVYPSFARLTLEAAGDEPYWMLYEGTPGGRFDPGDDYWRDSSGRAMPMSQDPERWNGRLPDPQWVLFGDGPTSRALFLALHEPDEHWDEFWHRGAGGMTVFGFGRGPRPRWQYLEGAPATLTIGLVDDSDPEAARRAVESAWRPLEVRLGEGP